MNLRNFQITDNDVDPRGIRQICAQAHMIGSLPAGIKGWERSLI